MSYTNVNPIRSGGGGGFCPPAFNYGATLICVGDFSYKK